MDSQSLSILQVLHKSQRATRRILVEKTGFPSRRVNAVVSKLLETRLVRESTCQDGTPGRPAGLLSINPDLGRFVGLDVGGTSRRAVLIDLNAQILASRVESTTPVPDRESILENITRLVMSVCQAGNCESSAILGIGIGVRGIVNPQTGIVLGWPSMPSWSEMWSGVDLRGEIQKRLNLLPVWVDDTVRAMAVNAYRDGPAAGVDNFLYVHLGTGIGSGIFVEGKPYVGNSGMSGELGHVTVDEGGPWCSCGNRGCLEVIASTYAVLRRTRERLSEPNLVSVLRDSYEKDNLTLSELLEAGRNRDKIAFQVLDETGTYVGRVIAIALNLLGPKLVVLGGPLIEDGGIILEAVQRQVLLNSLPHISQQVEIISDTGGNLSGARGSAMLAIDEFFSRQEYLTRVT